MDSVIGTLYAAAPPEVGGVTAREINTLLAASVVISAAWTERWNASGITLP